MAQSWKFVSTQADKKIDDPVVRKIVRETAMRAFRRRQRLQRVKEYQDMQAGGSQRTDLSHPLSVVQSESHEVARRGSQASQASQASGSPGRAFEEDSEEWADTIPPDIWPGPAFDPFSSTVLYSHHHAPYLFSHFVYNIAPSIQPFGSHVAHNPINSVLAQHALIDPVVLGAFLFHSAVHLDRIYHRPWSPLTLYHRGQLIRLLNKRLENVDESSSDNVIAAVTLLGTAGNITGNVRDDLLHKRALNRMIKMRGGLQGLGWDGALAILIYIGDLIAATVSTSNPLFSPPDIHTASPNILEYLESGPAVGLSSHTNLHVTAFRDEIYGLISSISKLDSIRSTSFGTFTASTAGMVNFSHNCFAVEHRLLSIRVTMGQHSSSQDPDIFIYEASRTAALMCITYLFRGMLLDGQIFTTLHKRLRIHIMSLESLNENIIADNTSLRILLWAYCVGGIISVERSWFTVRIHRCMSLLGFGSWEELKMSLMHYVWNPTMCDKFFTTLWPEVQSLLEL